MRLIRATAVGLLAGLVLIPADRSSGEAPSATCEGGTATIIGTDGDDDLTGTDGPDVVSLGSGDDVFVGLGGDDVVCGGDGQDRLDGGPGDDRIFGEGDSNDIAGGEGDDYIDGGTWWGFLYGDDRDPAAVGGGDDTILGSPLGDRIYGGGGDDVIDGRGEGDRISGGPGNDTLRGGAGDDRVDKVSGNDVVDGGGGRDLVSYRDTGVSVRVNLAAGTQTGAGRDTLVRVEGAEGSAGHVDVLLGSPYADTLVGNGADLVRAKAGRDEVEVNGGKVYTGSGRDRVDARGDAEVHTGSGNDGVEAIGKSHVLLGAGDDRGQVSRGAPVVEGGTGDDRFDLWWEDFLSWRDTFSGAQLSGGPGRDELRWEMDFPVRIDTRTHSVTSKRPHRDATFRSIHVFVGGDLDDVMLGGRGHDHFVGGFGNDRLYGRGGSDELAGGRGRDVLVGGRGHDLARGGVGVDTCRAEQRLSCERR
jgi:Ca2+-binding RTX toxin-like protein